MVVTPTTQKTTRKSSSARVSIKAKPTTSPAKPPTRPKLDADQTKQLQKISSSAFYFAQEFLADPSSRGKKFKARWMQIPLLKDHGNRLNTIRAQRGCGKTIAVMALLLWFAFTKGSKDVLIIGPYRMTVQRIFDELNRQIDASPRLLSSIKNRRMNPMEIKFTNGSIIRGLSTNVTSKTAGQAIRGEHPNFFYIDEADYLQDEDWISFASLIDPSEEVAAPPIVYATTTPTGRRSFFYQLCVEKGPGGQGEDWKDWWFPAKHMPGITFDGTYKTNSSGFFIPDPDATIHCDSVNPDWLPKKDARQRAMNGEQGYYHEIMAWWGDATSSVFPKKQIDLAMDRATKKKFSYLDERVEGRKGFYTLGVDVDKKQACPNLCVLEYLPGNNLNGTGGIFIVRLREEMERSEYPLVATRLRISALEHAFGFAAAYVDKTPGDFMVEELNVEGLMNVKAKSFRENTPFINPSNNEISMEPLKHVMINWAQRMFESGRVYLSPRSYERSFWDDDGNETVLAEEDWDDIFINQLRNYQVVKVKSTGVPEYTNKDEHAIDAFLLALWAAIQHFDNPYDFEFSDAILATSSENSTLFGGKGVVALALDLPPKETPEARYQFTDAGSFKEDYIRRHPQSTNEGRSFESSGNSMSFTNGRNF